MRATDSLFRSTIALLMALAATAVATAPALAAEEAATSAPAESGTYQVKPLTAEQATEYGLDTDFYKKATVVQDILIATSGRVPDVAHRETAHQFDMMMRTIDPEVAQRIRDRKVLCILVGHDEFTSDIPQFRSDKTGKELDFYNWRQRGFLTWKGGRPTVLFAEEDVLEYDGGMQIESILIHEFGHVIHGAGFSPEQQERLTERFKQAKAMGLWKDGYAAQRFRRVTSDQPVSLLEALEKSFPDQPRELLVKCLENGDILVNGKPTRSSDVKVTKDDKVRIVFGGEKQCYAGKNRSEYWAEVLQCWYDTNRTMDHDHNHIHTRAQLKAYDPGAARLCEEILGDSAWRFVSPRQRAGQGHLADFDPAKSPTVEDPEHIRLAALDYYDNYWKDFWQRLRDKHGIAPTADAAEEATAGASPAVARLAAGRATKPSSDKDYRTVDVRGWTFHIHHEYLNGDAEVLDNALKNAETQLGHVETLLPKKAVAKLKEVPVWVTPGRSTAEYHWERQWLINNGRNPDMVHAVQITDIGVLRRTRPTGPWVLLHELAHGYHDRHVGPEDKKAIRQAYNDALEKGLYQKVLHSKRRDEPYTKAYAATRLEEYFAECSEAYFGVNDFYPFVRAELREYDPAICAIIERVYHVNEGRGD